MFGFIEKIFMDLLNSIVNTSNHKNCVSLSNEKSTAHPTLIKLYPKEYTLGLC